jgi:hypothetical protein
MPDTIQDTQVRDTSAGSPHSPKAAPAGSDALHSQNLSALYDHDHIESVQKMSHDLKRLLTGCDAARLKTDVKLQVAKLNDWTTLYLKGLDAAQKISEAGYDTLIEAQKELGLSLDDFLRFEGEGGNLAPSPEQERRVEEMSKALRRISGLIPAVEETFASAEAGLNDPGDPEVEPSSPDTTPPDNAPEYDPPAPDGNPELPSEIPPVMDPKM